MPDFALRRTMMVDHQIRPADVTKFPVIAAFLDVPRERYVPDPLREAAYLGENLAIAPGRVMLDPRSLAKMLDMLDIQPEETILDLGCGHGYSTAVIARLARAVIAVEDDEALASEADQILSSEGVDNALVLRGPLADGAARHAPYDAIVVQGGVETVPPALTAQLREGGRIACIFMEGALGTCRIGHRADGGITWRYAFNSSVPVLAGFRRMPEFSL